MELGRAIVRELELDERGAVLERWMAHHVAGLISEVETASGEAKHPVEAQAVDIILKLWMHRRGLPEPADPLGGFRDAISVLASLRPEANPWRRYRRSESYEDLLYEMFQAMGRVILGGIFLTQVTRARSVADAEAKYLEKEETFLHAELDRWMQLVAQPAKRPAVVIKYVDGNTKNENEEQTAVAGTERVDAVDDQKDENIMEAIDSAIVDNLERMQEDLSALLSKWKSVKPEKPESEREEDW